MFWNNKEQAKELKMSVRTGLLLLVVGMFLNPAVVHAVTATFYSGGGSKAVPAPPKYGLYNDEVEDMRVKVQGGYIRVKRTRKNKEWFINYQWATLERGPSTKPVSTSSCTGGCNSRYVSPPVTGGTRLSVNDSSYDSYYILRSGVYFNNRGKDRYVFDEKPRFTITERNTAEGHQDFLWENHQGEWIDYKTNGQIESYGDANGVHATFTYDAAYKLTGVFDVNEKQVLWYEYNLDNLVSAIRDYSGRKVQYIYGPTDITNKHGTVALSGSTKQLTKVIDPNGNSWGYSYSKQFLVKKIDPEGRQINITGGQIVTSVLDQDGIGTFFKYDYNKTNKEFYRQEKSNTGKVTEFWFDKEGDLQRQDVNGITIHAMEKVGNTHNITDVNGLKTVEQYDSLDNLTKRTYPNGTSISYSVDTKYSKRTRMTDENGNVTSYEYDAKGNLIRVIEAIGKPETRTTEYDYDVYGNVTQYRRLADANTELAEVVLTYDAFGNVKTFTDEEGYVSTLINYDVMGNAGGINDSRGKDWVLEYDNKGNLKKLIDPILRSVNYTYNKVDKLVSVFDIANREVTYTYNAQHRLIKVTSPDLSIYQYEYTADGMVSKIIDESGVTFSYKYDLAGRILQTTDGNGNITSQVFDDTPDYTKGGFSQAYQIIYPTYTRQIEYDKRQRPVLNTILDGASGTVYRSQLDGVGNIVSSTNPEGKTEFQVFDAYNNLVKFTNYLHQDTLADYDDRGNLIKLTDAKLQIHRFAYDRKNYTTRETQPLGEFIQFGYDGAGNLVSRIDAKNQKSVFVYDDAERQTDALHYAAGNIIDPIQNIVFGYDNADNNNSWAISGNTETDRNMSRSAVYNNMDQLVSETTNFGSFSKTYNYGYFPNGNKKSITYPNAVSYGYTYDKGGLLNSVSIPGKGNISINSKKWFAPEKITLPGGITQNFGVNNRLVTTSITVKDPANNVISQQQLTLDALQNIKKRVVDNSSFDYTYDDDYRLTGVSKNTTAVASYQVDPVGNRVSLNSSTPWQYNINNELLSQGGVTYIYDDNGNQTKRASTADTKNFIYDTENHLTRVDNATNLMIARYGYDPFGQRLWKKTASGVEVYYLYSDEGLIAEYNVTGQLQKSYGYKPDSLWTTAPLFTASGGEYYYYQNDDPDAGTPQKIIAANGSVVWSAEYDAFGQAQVNASSSIENNLRLAGQYYDSETGLHYNWKRYYDTETGRYITMDPIGFGGGVNPYSYVSGDPINWIDPNGECGVPGAIFSLVLDYLTDTCGNPYTVERFVKTAVEGALCVPPWLKAAKKFKRPGKRPKPPCNSFTGETLVHTDQGTKSIQDIRVGDKVLSQAEWNGEQSYQEVTDVRQAQKITDMVTITLANGEVIEATGGHPFYVADIGWRDAALLNDGDVLVIGEQKTLSITSVEIEERYETVYNLTVANTHTFFVGEEGVLVHNAKCDITPDDLKDKSRDDIRDLAKQKDLKPVGDKNNPDFPRKWKDSDGDERLRLDRGHIDKNTGKPYNDSKAAGDHVHGYDKNGNKVRDPSDNNPHFPTK